MKILVLGGTRYFGIPMVKSMIKKGHEITIATRGLTEDSFGDKVKRVRLNVYDPESVEMAVKGTAYDLVIDKMGYGSKDIKSIRDNVDCDRIIHMSTAGVYKLNHKDIKEDEFIPQNLELEWCTRGEFTYDYLKQQAECALCNLYENDNWTSVRYPFVLGRNDYTGRLRSYVHNIIYAIPTYIDNIDEQFSVVFEEEAGLFFDFLLDKMNVGAINGCARGYLSISRMIDYIENKVNKKLILSEVGEVGGFNNTSSYSLSVDKAEKLGFDFGIVDDKIKDLLDYYIFLEKN